MEMSVVELQIPVPWGHIAVKAWGNKKDKPILAVHGFLDNAASFDQLVPLIVPGYYIVCADLPGHGLSSHYPDGVQITILGYVFDMKRIFNYFKWTECIVLCHSIGSHVCLYFASIFTEIVNRLIILDLFIGRLTPDNFVSDRCVDYFDRFLSIESKKSLTIYTHEEARDKFFENRYYYLANKSANSLLQRSVVKTEKGFIFTNDKRIRFLKHPLITKDFHFGLIRAIKCPVCITLSSNFEPFFYVPDTYDTFKVIRDVLKTNVKLNKIVGNHYVHLNEPKTVADAINTFIQHTSSRL